MNMINIGNRIKFLREEASISARDLAKKVNLDPSQISKIENGTSKPSLEALTRICSALDISLYDFFNESDNEISTEQKKLLEHTKSMTPEQIKVLNKFLHTFLYQEN